VAAVLIGAVRPGVEYGGAGWPTLLA